MHYHLAAQHRELRGVGEIARRVRERVATRALRSPNGGAFFGRSKLRPSQVDGAACGVAPAGRIGNRNRFALRRYARAVRRVQQERRGIATPCRVNRVCRDRRKQKHRLSFHFSFLSAFQIAFSIPLDMPVRFAVQYGRFTHRRFYARQRNDLATPTPR